tara:strand:- start:265 stop:432 length:168 start_codon:yes stop_codon:yes gene_type:complete
VLFNHPMISKIFQPKTEWFDIPITIKKRLILLSVHLSSGAVNSKLVLFSRKTLGR